MTKKLRFLMTALLFAVCGMTWAEETTITSTFTDKNLSVGENEMGWTASTAASGFENAGRGVQFGASSNLTSAESLDNVTKVVVVASTNNTGNTLSVKVGNTNFGDPQTIASGTNNSNKEYTFNVPAGSNASGNVVVSISRTAKSVYIKSISVTYEKSAVEKKDHELSFGETTVFTILKTDDFTAPTLINPNNLPVTYSSSNENYATVDESTGEVTILEVGEVTITATFAGDDEYKAGSVSYKIIINAAKEDKEKPEGALFFDAFNETDGTGGHDGKFSGAVGSSTLVEDEEGNWTESNGCGGAFQCVKFGTSNGWGNLVSKEIALTGNGTLTFIAAGWGDTNNNKLNVTAEGATLEGDTEITLTNGAWAEYTVNITDAEGAVVLTFNGKRGFIDDILVMAEETPTPETVTVNIKASNGYGTFCSTYPVQFSANDGVEAYIATGINDAKTSIQTQKIEDGYVPAGVGVIVKASGAGEYAVAVVEATDVMELDNNLMVGCTEAIAVPSEGCYIIYAGDGCFHPCFTGTIPAGKAYLNIAPETVSPTEGKVLDIIEGNIDPTAINEIEITTENAAIYTLGGVRVKDAQQKGIYIINGKKVVK